MTAMPAVVAPTLAVTYYLGALFDGDWSDASAILDWAALAILVAGFFVVSRLQLALKASDAAADAWHEEKLAVDTKCERLTSLLAIEEAKNKVLEARPTLELLVASIEGMSRSMERHEAGAAERTDRVIAAIKEASPV